MVKITDCFSGGPGLNSQHTHGASRPLSFQLQEIQGLLWPSPAPGTCVAHSQTYRQNTNTYKINKVKNRLKQKRFILSHGSDVPRLRTYS